MAVFVTSTSQATRHGIYAIERIPPATIQATGSGTVAIVEQFPWGPVNSIYTISSMSDFINTFAPPGMVHTGAGYMSVVGKAWPVLKVVRVMAASGTASASVTINKTGPSAFIVVTAKYPGTAGNSLTATTAAATDGDANHFNLTVSVTSTTGTTTDFIENLNYSGTGADSTPDLTKCKLITTIVKSSSGTPIIGTTSFTGGLDGTIASTDYVGTAGTANKGIALLEGDPAVDIVITGDPGNTLRPAVNAGLVAHAALKTDRMVVVNGPSGQTGSAARTDVASYRDVRAAYIDVWANQSDDTDGTVRLVAPAPFFASVAAVLAPSTSPAWKSTVVQSIMKSIVSLEANRGEDAYQNTQAGICTLIQEVTGGFTFESAVVTAAPVSPAKKDWTRSRMGHYIARSITTSLREYTDAPNVSLIQNDEVHAVTTFLDGLAGNVKTDPINLPHIVGYTLRPLGDFNTQASIDNGDFFIPVDVKTSTGQAHVFLSMQFGPTVSVDVVL